MIEKHAMRKVVGITALLGLFGFSSAAQQNAPKQKLTYTEGFERCFPCNDEQKLAFCKGWEDTPVSRVFVMSDCNNAVPYNPYGTQYPFEGKGYAALRVLRNTRMEYNKEGGDKTTYRMRDYMRLVLPHTLEKGKRYAFSFYVSLAERSAFSALCLAVDVSTRRLKQDEKWTALLKADNAFELRNKTALSDTVNWHHLSTTITAKGGERFVTIGIFKQGLSFSSYRGLVENAYKPKGNGSTYFIDNVTIMEL